MNNFDFVKENIKRLEFSLARQLLPELTDGTGSEHHQSCPFCGGTDRFYHRPESGTFHCRQCFTGDIFDLVSERLKITKLESLQLVAETASIHIESKPDGKPTAPAAAKVKERCPAKPRYITATYQYKNLDGTPAFTRHRYEHQGYDKYVPYPTGFKKDRDIIPYRLETLQDCGTLIIHEGEKCVDVFNADNTDRLDIAATTTGDCGTWNQWKRLIAEYPFLAEKQVIIVEDNDTAGGKYALETAAAFYNAGNKNIKIVLLPTGIEGGDYADWREGKKNPVGAFLKIVAETKEYKPAASEKTSAAKVDTPKTGNEHLDRLLTAIDPIDWTADENDKGGVSEKISVMRTTENAIITSKNTGILFCSYNELTWIYNGKFWNTINAALVRRFLEYAALRCGVKADTAAYFRFIDNLEKQFIGKIALGQERADSIVINQNNGTLHFIEGKPILKPHNPDNFLRYCLPSDYDPADDCPQWMNHLQRCGFDSETIDYLAECFALPFCNLKGEQVVFIYGRPHSGKSVILDVYRGILGEENTTAIDLSDLTQGGQAGSFTRAELDGKLANIATDITPKVFNSGMFKMLAEGAPILVERKHKNPFKMVRYAKMFFAANELPYIKARELSLRKWSIFETKSVIPVAGRKLNFAKELIATEASGILNWILAGLERLTKRGDLPQCRAITEAASKYELETDTVLQWLLHEGITDETPSRELAECFRSFTEYCESEGIEYRFIPKKREFSARLQMNGYEVETPNRHTNRRCVRFKQKSIFEAQEAHKAQTPENAGSNAAPYIAPNQSKTQSKAQEDTLENKALASYAPYAPQTSGFFQKQIDPPEKSLADDNFEGDPFAPNPERDEAIVAQNIRGMLTAGNDCFFNDVCDMYFNGDRVTASAFLERNRLLVDADGKIVETKKH
ncbi:hypothetical protein FACS189454_08460 [Planctomycetales bacterium]|nr:hypothetical protein FACS189454_08460 [Planctomycetales bacterium]